VLNLLSGYPDISVQTSSTMAARWQDDVGLELMRLRNLIRKPSTRNHVHASSELRVNKWDALVLDAEIMALMKHPIKNMFALYPPGLMEKYQPEVDSAMHALHFFFTFGMREVSHSQCFFSCLTVSV
jgi:hypothetical protein